jgi:hypothetical protein
MPRPAPAPVFTTHNAGSLLTTATVTESERLLDGLSFKPELCVSGALLELCPSPESPVEKEIAAGQVPAVVPTYGFYEGDICSTMAGLSAFDETAARVSRAVQAHTGYWAEQALWDGLGTMTGSQALAASGADDINGGAAVGIVPGLSDMIAALNAVLGGARGVIHVSQSILPFLMFYGQVVRNGNFLQVSGTDHNVVAGTGYSGNDPDGNAPLAGESWIYGTGPVSVVLSSVQIVPDLSAAAIDRTVNTVEVRAERGLAAYFDPCAHIGLPVCLPDPGPACEAS